jgi:uncharacterized protein YraI
MLAQGMAGAVIAAHAAPHAGASYAVHAAQASAQAPSANCTVTILGSNVNLRTGPHLSDPAVAELQKGQKYTSPGCTSVTGDEYGAVCGAHVGSNLWREITYKSATRYFAAECGNVA